MKNSDSKDYLIKLGHSAAHLVAAAVMELWPGTKRAIGPAIENGFYYDFDFGAVKISETDFPKIEEKMRELVKSWTEFTRVEISWKDAQQKFSDNPYKLELIGEFHNEEKKLTIYKSGDFEDLCRGGHVENPAEELQNFKLLSVAGAYWRGSEKNKMLTRIYGTCWPTKEELEKYLWQQEEAKKRDHRKIGKEQDLFLISQDIGGGLPIFTAKGLTLRNIVSDYITHEKVKRGYQFVWTPHVARSAIYIKSGHWQKYDAMFNAMKLDEEEYVLKPMNCPHHFQVFLNRPRSYRELPMRIAENGTCYRYEKSGELNGLLRVRSVTIDDTHTFIRYSQTMDEINRVLKLILDVFKTFGFNEFKARISTRDLKTPEKYLGDSQHWDRAEEALLRGVKHLQIESEIGEGEAAFYGPKIDMMVKDSIGREWQLSTLQLDYNQPNNFDMNYVDERGQLQRPAVLHIAVLGSLERFVGILIEHFGGAFPTWLNPVQVKVLPVAERHIEYAKGVTEKLKQANIRAELDERNETLSAKIRDAQHDKVSYMLICGDKEVQTNTVTERARSGKPDGPFPIETFIGYIRKEIDDKINT